MIAAGPGFSTLPSFGTAVTSRYTPPSISGRYTKNTHSGVTVQNQARRSLLQRTDGTLQ